MKNKLFIFLCFVSFSVCAQNGIGVQEVQVTESYKPQVPIVSKIMDLPLVEDSSKKEIKMSYLLNSKQYQTTYLIDTISAAKIKGEPLQKIYPSYIKLGIGTDALPNLDVFYNSSRDKTLNYGARLGFLQSYLRAKSVYDNQKVDANSKHTNVHLYGKKVLDFGTIYSSFSRKGNNFLAYGVDPSLQLSNDDINQYWGYSNLDVSVRSNSFKKIKYFARLSLSDVNEQTESSIGFQSRAEGVYNDMDLSLDFNVDYDFNNHNNEVNFYDSEIKEVIYSAIPSLQRTFFNIDGEYGFNMVVVNDFESSRTSFYPKVHLSYSFINSLIYTYAGLDGGIKHNSYWNLSQENPFILNALDNGNKSAELINSDIIYNFYSGAEAKISSDIILTSKMSFSKVDFIPFFELDNSSLYQNKFKVIYDNGYHLHLSSQIDYNILDKKGLRLELNYHSYNLDSISTYSYKPSFTSSLKGYYNVGDKIIAQLELFGEFERTKVLRESQLSDLNLLEDFFDINLSIEYRFNKVFSSYLTAHNLVGGYQVWHNYSVLGTRVQFGLSYQY